MEFSLHVVALLRTPGGAEPCPTTCTTPMPRSGDNEVMASLGHHPASMTPWPTGRGVVEFPDGRRVRGRGLRAGPISGEEPGVGYYLLAKPPPPTSWPARWIRWPDFRLPVEQAQALLLLTEAYRHSAQHRVEIACAGGRGRTGCALAVLAVLSGIAPADAVDWVRAAYHPRAVETPWQRRWIAALDASSLHAAR